MEDDDNVKLLLTHIRKMQNIAEVEKLAIDKTALLNKVAVSGKRPDISIRKIWVVQQVNIKEMAVNAKRSIIY